MQNLLAQLRRVGSRYSAQQKVAMVVMVILVVVAVWFLASYVGRTKYQTLFTGLDGKDAADVTKKLEELKVPYKVEGTTISVAAGQVDQARIKLAGAGLPTSGAVGYEIFDKSTFGASDFTQQINYQRALEGELARTISAMAPVESAVVHLAMPKEELFTADDQPVTASVLVKLSSGKDLDNGQVEAIQNLVSGGVRGLKSENVTVTDSAGNALSGGDSPSAMTSEQLRSLAAYQTSMEASLQSVLDRVVGPDKGVVKVKADLDFTSRIGQVETYTTAQAGGLPQDAQATQESYGSGGATAGTPGTTSNVPDYTTVTAAPTGSGYLKTESKTVFNNDKTVEEVKTPPGKVLRLSTAVLIDKSAKGVSVAPLQNALEAAAGFDAARGDVLTVEVMQFDKALAKDAEKALAGAASKDKLWGMVKTGALALLALLALFFLWRRLKKVKAQIAVLPAVEAMPMGMMGEPQSLDAVMAKAQPLLNRSAKTPVLASIEMLANQRPDELAQLLQTIMKERE